MSAPTGGNNVSNSVIAERVGLILSELADLKKDFVEFKDCHQGFVLDYERRHAVVDNSVSRAHQRIDELQNQSSARWKEVDTLREQVLELRHANKQITWFGGLVGSSIIIWMVSQFMGLL